MRYRRIISTMLFLAVCCLLFSSGFLLGRRTAGGTYRILTEHDNISHKVKAGLKGDGSKEEDPKTISSHAISDVKDLEGPNDVGFADIIKKADSARPTDSELTDISVNINTCDVDQLTLLPSIGETRAKSIIKYRDENGPFRSVADIMQVSGIGESIYDKIKPYIYVDIYDTTRK